MPLWLIKRFDLHDWDEHDSAVIRAATEAEARKIAGRELRPEDGWHPRRAECVPLEADGPPGVVVASFNAG